MSNAKIYLNGIITWWTSINATPPDQIDFRGTLTHEVGHWVFLKDLACAPGPTMCHNAVDGTDTYDWRSLDTDDVNAANAVY